MLAYGMAIDSPSGEAWTGRLGFILAAIGSAVGLGNVWRFAYVAGENGGAAFLLVYALCVLLIGLPVLLAEFVLGSRARGDVVRAFSHPRAARAWRGAGALAALVAFLILSYYSVIAGWAARYFFAYLDGSLPALPREAIPGAFAAFLADPLRPALWHGAFMALTAAVVALGVARGIERASRVLMPLLAAMVVVLALYALTLPGAGRGLAFLFAPDWTALAEPRLYLAALGQTFFSLGVAMGVMITYASYVRAPGRLAVSAAAVAAGDTLFAVFAGMAIFPIVFAFGMDPAQGPALAFVTLPQVFALMPGGAWIGTAFFFLLTAAALTSAVSLLEVPVAIAARLGLPRAAAALALAASAFAAGVPSALGTSVWRELTFLGRGILEAVDFVAADVLLPLVGIAVVLYAGWALPRAEALEQSGLPPRLARAWHALVRHVAPVAMLVFLATLVAG
jgi:neurotransmitter:Na+ symporter, NSS family